MNKLIISGLVVFTLLGCANNSSYQAASGNGYGYSETELGENRYRIDYKARGSRASEAKNYALLRAAELTLENNYDWFVVVDRETHIEKTRDSVTTSVHTDHTVTRSCGLLGCTTHTHPTTGYGMGMSSGPGKDEAVASLEIRMGKGVKPDRDDVYDAQEVKDRLGV